MTQSIPAAYRMMLWLVSLALATGPRPVSAAPITWQAPKDVAADTDIATNGTVLKAYTFATGNTPTVNGMAFQPFGTQPGDKHTLANPFKEFYGNPALSAAYNQLLAGGVQDTAHLATPTPQQLTLFGLVPGRRYQLQIWVADSRSWPALNPAFASAAQTVQGSSADTDVPTLHWEGGPTGPTAQYVIGTFTADKTRQKLTFTPTAGFFNGKKWFSSQINALLLSDLSPGTPPPPPAEPVAATVPIKSVSTLDDCNVVWDSPSEDSFGSMPLGNGDVGLNVWVEESGDLLFYISKVDAYDADHNLKKLGRVRLHLTPPLATDDFQQSLVLRDGAIAIKGGAVNLRLWVDANSPVIHVEGTSTTPRQAAISIEPLRPLTNAAAAAEVNLPAHGTAGILLDDKANRLAWCYRNMSSAWAEHLRSQNTPAMVAKAADPILRRTSGCLLQGAGLERQNAATLAAGAPSNRIDCTIQVLSIPTPTLPEWFAQLARPVPTDWAAHQKWWQAFWERSHIFVSACGTAPVQLEQGRFEQCPQASLAYRGHNQIPAAQNAFQLSQRYALERFCEACAGRGLVPPPYNGSIFTMDMPAGAMGFDKPKSRETSADHRDWGTLSFMWQNTRHPYWSMATRGDYDTLLPGLRFVREGLEICQDHCQNIFHHDGAFIMEASWWHNVGVFNWNGVPQHLRFHLLATIETPAMMCEYYEHTQDRKFLNDILLPCADEFIKFYELQFPRRDGRGKMLMEPAACVETYQPVTNPATEICALRFVLQHLTSLDPQLSGPERHAHWAKLLGELPDVPLRTIKGLDLLAVGDPYAPGREICETPEMYSVYPFRQVWLGRAELLAAARQSLHVRNVSLDGTVDNQPVETGGWQAVPVQAAYLGLPREAARLTSINYNDRFIHWANNVDPNAPFPSRPHARFPAFWETKMDYTPDNDHGANSANALQSMLLQSAGRKIYLLPAWPEDWDVSFKLCAACQTTVECVYRGGKVQALTVTPAERQADVVDMSSADNRIRTLVSVACGDRNYLFGLPPMLDGVAELEAATNRPATGPWLAQYGASLAGTRGGPYASAPWGGSVFKDSTVYLHVLDCTTNPIILPPISRKLLASQCLTGGAATVQQTAAGLTIGLSLEGKLAGPDTIVKLDFDGPIEPIALAAPCQNSLTTGAKITVSSAKADRPPENAIDANAQTMWAPATPGPQWLEVDLGKPVTFDRAEIHIDHPNYRRGQAIAFDIQTKQPDGSWHPCYQGHIYGTICGKKFPAVTAQFVRLNITAASGVRQFDLFAAP